METVCLVVNEQSVHCTQSTRTNVYNCVCMRQRTTELHIALMAKDKWVKR